MFWGLKLVGGRQYSQVVERPFHISQACVGRSPGPLQGPLELHVVVDKTDYLLCHLDASQQLLQYQLNLNFSEGEEVVFYCESLRDGEKCTVFLTGYFVEGPPTDHGLEELAQYFGSDLESEEEEEEEEEEGKEGVAGLELLSMDLPSSDSSDEDYSSGLMAQPPALQELVSGEEGQEGKEKKKRKRRDREGSRKDVDGEEKQVSKRKRIFLPLQEEQSQSPPKQAKLKSQPQTDIPSCSRSHTQAVGQEAQEMADKVVTLKGGTEIQDIQIGTGRAVKTGQMVFVKYKGWLDHNMKVFDSNMEGSKPFRFRLGHGEVIRGWDEGLQGMKAGGRRRVVVPPRQGYGAKGAPPTIPPNAKLIFELHLIRIK